MKSSNFRFDKKLVSFYTVVILISALIIIYKMRSAKECPEIVFNISDTNIVAGELVQFTNRTKMTESVKWDFGDNSVQVNEASPTHIYLTPGEFMLRLTINNQCQEVRKILVNPKKALINETLIPKFTCPEYVSIGKIVRFVCLTNGVKSWEWRLGETGKIDSKEKNPTYTFKTPGAKTVSLVVNGNYNYIAKRVIYIMSPEPPKAIAASKLPNPAPKAQTYIPEVPDEYASYEAMKVAPQKEKEKEKEKILLDDELMSALINYSKGRTKVSHMASSFCDKIESAPVVANGKLTNLNVFLDKIIGKTVVFKELKTIREKNGCITQLIVKYKSE